MTLYSQRTKKTPIIFALSDSVLEQHHIEVDSILIKAHRDDSNRVYWPLPDCMRTYDKQHAQEAAELMATLVEDVS